MIYLFGTGKKISISYGGKGLSQSKKDNASVALGRLPKHEVREGFVARLQIDAKTKEVSYYYEEIVIEQNEED